MDCKDRSKILGASTSLEVVFLAVTHSIPICHMQAQDKTIKLVMDDTYNLCSCPRKGARLVHLRLRAHLEAIVSQPRSQGPTTHYDNAHP